MLSGPQRFQDYNAFRKSKTGSIIATLSSYSRENEPTEALHENGADRKGIICYRILDDEMQKRAIPIGYTT
ncbi:hypothetical protein [Xenorhabdus szentirmaii]|uniref:Uncharacterized protein n=1 Tax=Xenorhabdus szentirmaii DSM 16338 TaxID=1427518 RepID=W1IZE6_9GAMM|nr:hypothetical protein [Xenorhabdus szentirmaii]CDL83829.1 hypothetical protein XSR1_370043 [Xenorhabdus szentirmaii DSM 16338]